jgi:predicted ribosome quality control (RQC) complex YloA/Tae2 family protein
LLNKENQIPIFIKPITAINLDDNVSDNLLPKTEFENIEPNFVDDGVSVSIDYKWQIVPFYLPEKASENSLYDRWKKKTEEIIKALDSILNKIQDAEKRETNWSKKISRLVLGKKNVFSALINEIENLKTTDFANQPDAKLKEKINRINEINAQVQNEIGEIEIEDRKAKLDEEIENLKKDISEKEKELETKKQELEAKKQDEEQKKFMSKTESEIKEIEKKINSFKNQIDSKEKEKNKQIQQSSSSSLELLTDKNAKQTNSTKSQLVQLPDLQQLPSIGKLYQVNSQSYLAIQFWEEYEQGKKESERLKAKLCAI